MPMVEVLYVKDESLDPERKHAFTEEAVSGSQEDLGAPPERLRLVFRHVEPEEGGSALVGLSGAESKGGRAPSIGGGSNDQGSSEHLDAGRGDRPGRRFL